MLKQSTARLSGQIVPAGLHVSDEVPPPGGPYGQDGAARVFGVTDSNGAREAARDLHAVTATVAAVAGLVPTGGYLVFHCSAASRMSIRDSSRGSASPR